MPSPKKGTARTSKQKKRQSSPVSKKTAEARSKKPPARRAGKKKTSSKKTIHQKAPEAVTAVIHKVASHPSAILTEFDGETLTLKGPASSEEASPLLEQVAKIEGIKRVDNKLDVFQPAQTSNRKGPEGLRNDNQFRYEPDFRKFKWRPWIRLCAGVGGIALLGWGLKRRGAQGAVLSTLGAALGARAFTNQAFISTLAEFTNPTLKMHRKLRVNAPVEEVFNFWKNFQNYPKFMSYIDQVRLGESGALHWIARGPMGTRLQWDTQIHQLIPNQMIGWKSATGSFIASEGIIRMKPTSEGGTEIDVELNYSPPAGAIGYLVSQALGFDPGSRIDQDLQIAQRMAEQTYSSNRGQFA